MNQNTLTFSVDAAKTGATIDRNVYGHFAEHLGRCIYEGFWVGEDSPIPNVRGIRSDVVAALKRLDVPVLRWPGGCFADEYHWRDGIGPRETRPGMINTHWGGRVENNHFGTHEFFDLCEMLGAQPYVCGNVGSGTPQEMMEWVEYMTSDADSPMARLRRKNGRDAPWHLTYFGVGNESWGCGGNMRPEYYADEYRRYNTFVKNYASPVYRIACGANDADYNWTRVLMERARHQMNGLSLHYYTVPTGNWDNKGSATQFSEAEYHETLRRTLMMEERLAKHTAIMDEYDPQKKVGLIVDEWGIWTNPEPGSVPGFLYQQNSLRDAVVAALNFHVFHRYADRVAMTNIAQTVNVLQAMVLTDGAKMILTPTYHVFEMFRKHQGAEVLTVHGDLPSYTLGKETIPAVSVSASKSANGVLLTLAATNPHTAYPLRIELASVEIASVRARVLTAGAVTDCNRFDAPDAVSPRDLPVKHGADYLELTLPAQSVVALEING